MLKNQTNREIDYAAIHRSLTIVRRLTMLCSPLIFAHTLIS